MRIGAFVLDLQARELRHGATQIQLQSQPFEILRMLLERPGGVVTRDELRHRLWPDGVFVDFEHSLNSAIKRLRAALGDDAERPAFVETVPRRGYRFIGPRPHHARPPRIRLVVLPFTTISEDVGFGYFSDGLTEEVIAQLKASSRTVDIVTPWSSLFDHPLHQRARDLGKSLRAEYLLEGSTRHQGRRVRITARLVDTDTEIHLWSGIFEHVVTDTLAVQAEVAGHLAGTIITALESSRTAATLAPGM
jgi:TolB-like protein